MRSSDWSSDVCSSGLESGTYYLDIIAYDNLTTEEPQIGGYSITAKELDPANFDPLDAINRVNADNVSLLDVDGTPTAYVFFAVAGDSSEERSVGKGCVSTGGFREAADHEHNKQ